MERIEFVVHGKVQKVYFRVHTEEKAISLGLVGWVKNLPDGTVQGIAEGSKVKIQEFRAWLNVGSPMSRVDRVVDKYTSIEKLQFTSFGIDRKKPAATAPATAVRRNSATGSTSSNKSAASVKKSAPMKF